MNYEDPIGINPLDRAASRGTAADIEGANWFLQRRVDRGVTCPRQLRLQLDRYFNWEVSSTTCERYVDTFLNREAE
jgi:hypothetical protein